MYVYVCNDIYRDIDIYIHIYIYIYIYRQTDRQTEIHGKFYKQKSTTNHISLDDPNFCIHGKQLKIIQNILF